MCDTAVLDYTHTDHSAHGQLCKVYKGETDQEPFHYKSYAGSCLADWAFRLGTPHGHYMGMDSGHYI